MRSRLKTRGHEPAEHRRHREDREQEHENLEPAVGSHGQNFSGRSNATVRYTSNPTAAISPTIDSIAHGPHLSALEPRDVGEPRREEQQS